LSDRFDQQLNTSPASVLTDAHRALFCLPKWIGLKKLKLMAMPHPNSLFALLLFISLNLLGVSPGFAASTPAVDLEHGGQLFSANCAACHMGGGNVISASRTLSQRDLQAHLNEYSDDHIEAIEHQIENGKNAMPSFVGKLSEQDIIDVAAYVELKAEKGWQR
jgi:cytochrome c6